MENTYNDRGCVVPSDIIRWLENNSDQLTRILSRRLEKINNKCDTSPFTLGDEVEKHRSDTNSLVMDEVSKNSVGFRQSIVNLLERLDPQNKELIKFMFYDEAGNIITEKIILALNNSTTLSDLDREYISENCIEIFNDTENNPIFSIKLYHDINTKNIIAKSGGYPSMIFDKIDYIDKDEKVMPIYGDLGVFSKDCEVLIYNKEGKGTLISRNTSYPLHIQGITPNEIKRMNYDSRNSKDTIEVTLSTGKKVVMNISINNNVAHIKP